MAEQINFIPTFSDESIEEKEFDENLLEDYNDAFDRLMSPEFDPLTGNSEKEGLSEPSKTASKTVQFKPVKIFKHNVKQSNPNSEKKQENSDIIQHNSQSNNGLNIEHEAIRLEVNSPIKQAAGDSPEIDKSSSSK